MSEIRKAAVAGQFYPGSPEKLQKAVYDYIEAVVAIDAPAPKAIIAPHAGYVYSGPIAGTAYAHLAGSNGAIRRVVLIGPAHRAPVPGLAASSAKVFTTPLGQVPLDEDGHEKILSLPQVEIYDHAHAREHCLEVHLPFLQTIFGDFKVVPLVVGEASPSEVGQVLDRLWGASETVIVISSDLSHYYDYKTAVRLDKATSEAIETLQPLQEGQACGRKAINGLLHVARERGLFAHTVDLRNSGDTAGPRDQVVGYGAFVFWEERARP